MKQRAIRGGIITSASQVIMFVLRLASIMVLARLLIPEHFGLIGMVTALTVFIERFEDLGLGDAVVQRTELTHEQVSTLFWLNIGICFFIAIVVAVCAKAVAWFYNDQRLIWITVALASNFVFSGLSIQHQALIRRRMRFDHFALIKIISTVLSLGIAIILAWQGFGYWALVWKEISRSLTVTVLAWLFCPWRPGLPVRNAGVKSMLKFGGNVTGYNILYYLSNNLDSILLGKFFGAVPVGLYSRARQLAAIPMGPLLEPMQYVSLPALSALQNDHVQYRNYFEKMLAILCFLYMPIIVYIGIYSHPIVYIALGSQWMNTVPIFRLLAFSAFASPIVVMLGLIMISTGQSRRYFFWGLFTSLSTIIAFVVGIRWGAIGLAASWSVSTMANLIFSLFFVFKGSPVGIVSTLKSIYKPAIASIGMGIVLLQTYNLISSFHVALQMALSILLGIGIYFIVWVLFPGGYKKMVEFASYPLSALKRKRVSAPNEII
ncbi:MAG: lipopolysaccharide biosynthesis protein [Syntrophus sp. (in: bacteria)]